MSAIARHESLVRVLLVAGAIACAVAASPSGAAPRDAAPAESLAVSRRMIDAGRYEDGERAARSALQLGWRDSSRVADALDRIIEARYRSGVTRDTSVRALSARALAIRSQARDSLGRASTLHQLGCWRREAGDLPGAVEALEEAAGIRERRLGPDHLDVASSLNALAAATFRQGRHARAESLFTVVRARLERAQGPDAPELAATLSGLGLLRIEQKGDPAGARDLFVRALAIRERALGPDHVEVAAIANNLGAAEVRLGNVVAARALFERCLAIRERALGPEHRLIANPANQLGIVLARLGDNIGARRSFERAVRILERTVGPQHPQLGLALNNLANTMREEGDLQQAKPLYERSVAITEKTQSRDQADASRNLNNYGLLLGDLGENARAREVLERVLHARERLLPPDHFDLASPMTYLGSVHLAAGEPAAAESLLARAVAIRERAGKGDLETGPALYWLGVAQRRQGRNAEAERSFERAVELLSKHVADHPDAGRCLVELAHLRQDRGDRRGALDAALEAERIGRRHLRMAAAALSEREALLVAATRSAGLDVALSVVTSGPADSGEVGRVWDAAMQSRTLVLDEMAQRHRGAVSGGDQGARQLADSLATARRRLTRLLVRGPGEDTEAGYLSVVGVTRAESERLERALAERSPSFRRSRREAGATLGEVVRGLPPATGLVAYETYTAGGSRAYAAFLTRPGGRPEILPLGAADEIERSIAHWRDEARSSAQAGRSWAAAERSCRRAGDDVRRRLWDPVSRRLEGVERVLVVPEGAVHLVSFGALPAARGGFLVERAPVFHLLTSERDVTRAEEPRGRGLFALGGAAFDSIETAGAIPAGAKSALASMDGGASAPPPAPVFRGARSSCRALADRRFEPLPASGAEVDRIATLWRERSGASQEPVLELLGAAAGENAFKRLAPGRRVLHLATHGFFLGGSCDAPAPGARGVGGLVPAASPAPAAGENPLLLAGLAVAGANRRAETGPDMEDGVLTAEEIASVDLSGTEWAVLSGCDTGAGTVAAGEGVLGLRRAFRVAGASTVIMSLWTVEDRAARDWMSALYRARLADGLDTAEAVRRASVEMLAARRARHESTHPFLWGAFVAAGDWR